MQVYQDSPFAVMYFNVLCSKIGLTALHLESRDLMLRQLSCLQKAKVGLLTCEIVGVFYSCLFLLSDHDKMIYFQLKARTML